MPEFIVQNIGTIAVAAVLIAVTAAIVIKMYRDKKSGKSSCSCGNACGSCPMSGKCHGESEQK